jgi:hypothetical protein
MIWEKRSKSLDRKRQAKLQNLQDPIQYDEDILNNERRENTSDFGEKMKKGVSDRI